MDVAGAIKAALSKKGSPYVWGAAGPSTFDCSGLMVWAYNKVGVQLPRTSQAMAKYGKGVSPKSMQPGDLVTSNWGSGPSSHVAMYIGGGKVVHAPRPGKGVTVANLDENYRSRVDAIRRVPGATISGVSRAGWTDPLKDFWEWEKEWTEKLLKGDLGGAGESFGEGAGELYGSLLAPLRAATESLTDIARGMLSVGDFAEFLLKLALPSTWVRITSGVIGTVLLFLGLGFLVREAQGGA